MAELGEKVRAAPGSALEDGEELRGACVATQSSLFKGRAVAIGVTDGWLLVQPLTRKLEPAVRRSRCRPSGSPEPKPTA